MTHLKIDQRSLALHRLVVEKIRKNPALFDNVKRTLTHWRSIVSVNSQPYLEEWEQLVNKGIDTCLTAAVEDSEHADALRQTSPFCGILTNQERFVFFKEWRQKNES
jgi:hypothetical protein